MLLVMAHLALFRILFLIFGNHEDKKGLQQTLYTCKMDFYVILLFLCLKGKGGNKREVALMSLLYLHTHSEKVPSITQVSYVNGELASHC